MAGARHSPAKSERKTLLRKMLPHKPRAVVYVQHFASGTDLFRVICERDMEGVVAKQASARYTPEATTWVKIKNRQYSQAVGREDFFSARRQEHKSRYSDCSQRGSYSTLSTKRTSSDS